MIFIEDALAEARNLTFTEKYLNTIENIINYWKKCGEVPKVPSQKISVTNTSIFQWTEDTTDPGVAYACDDREAPIIYNELMRHGVIKDRQSPNPNGVLEITGLALQEYDRIKAGRERGLNRGFFIRKFDKLMDEFFQPVMEAVQEETGCQIKAIWEMNLNEKLDERILREIEQSSVIVADVTGDKFNVGLELGYALALQKRVILLVNKHSGKDGQLPALPFDISTLNCYFYDKSDPEELKSVLIARTRRAMEASQFAP